ncbi:B3/B4 domain-containing protein [Catellatospora tritici]|uniref:B3/B4 domain-containing protein n=1 Tax=Catellatospora tritici TaxID=2851566 RepID=UPI001C2D40D7|nr:phenylalanine--tRNA ligase beta subunit-related protein [Catellatospora tritici]MBV1850003.1 hypothetical protein [Catellatospora tritici]
MTLPSFTVSEDVSELGIKAIAFVLPGLSLSEEYGPELREELMRREKRLLTETTADGLKQQPLLRGFRDLHARVGSAAKREIAAPEALLRLLHRNARLPRISPLVDIYNIVSAETMLALGAHDLNRLAGAVRLARTDGSEKFVPLGAAAPVDVTAGEYAYLDDEEILCRLEVRQCDKSKVTLAATDVVFIVHAGPAHPENAVHEAMEQLVSMIHQYCGGGPAKMLSDGLHV